jgi:hypothetical protein
VKYLGLLALVISVVLGTLKVVGVVALSWLVVLAPVLIYLGINLLVLVLGLLAMAAFGGLAAASIVGAVNKMRR